MSADDVLLILLNDPNLLPTEREALERLLRPNVTDHAVISSDAPQANVERTSGIVEGDHGQ